MRRRQRDGRILIGRIDERGEGVRVLAALRGVVGECGSLGSFVVCRRDGGAFGVWELPDAGVRPAALLALPANAKGRA